MKRADKERTRPLISHRAHSATSRTKKGGRPLGETCGTLCPLRPHHPGEHRLQNSPQLVQVHSSLLWGTQRRLPSAPSRLRFLAALLNDLWLAAHHSKHAV